MGHTHLSIRSPTNSNTDLKMNRLRSRQWRLKIGRSAHCTGTAKPSAQFPSPVSAGRGQLSLIPRTGDDHPAQELPCAVDPNLLRHAATTLPSKSSSLHPDSLPYSCYRVPKYINQCSITFIAKNISSILNHYFIAEMSLLK